MTPQRFAEANGVMAAPPGMDNCFDIHAHRNGTHVITAWRPTPEELVQINLGQPIWLVIHYPSMPPVSLTTEYPFVEQAAKEDA